MWGRIPSSSTSSGTPVYLNIYDLTPINGYMYWLGLGIYHSAVEAYGVEYAFGAHDYPTSGVFEVEPRTCPGFTFRKTVLLGTTNLGQKEFREFIEQIAFEYGGNSYHLIVKNCNHFCDDVCMRLTGSSIPGWVNRLARLGSLCNCLLPEGLQVNAVPQISEYQAYEDHEHTSDKEDETVLGVEQGESQSEEEEFQYLLSVRNTEFLIVDKQHSNVENNLEQPSFASRYGGS